MAFALPNPFVWDQSFDVGSATMNEQHVKLFQLIDALEKNRVESNWKALVDMVRHHPRHHKHALTCFSSGPQAFL